MRQHVNPLSKHFDEIERIPSLKEMFKNPKFNLHLDIGCAAGAFLIDLAIANPKWNFIKTDVNDLFKYMDYTISSNLNFKAIDKKDFDYSSSFNPSKIPTYREKYVTVNQLDIFEKIYVKI